MGHERVGALPKTKAWREVVEQLGLAAQSDDVLHSLADTTLERVRSRFEGVQHDAGVQAAFGFLVALAGGRFEEKQVSSRAVPSLDLGANPSALRLVNQLDKWIRQQGGSREHAELATRAAADAIGAWVQSQSRQGELFRAEEKAETIWKAAENGAAFCEISRVFFGKFLERYLRFFLEREASAEISNLELRTALSSRLSDTLDELSKHAFETAKITQSFAAGWFNKRVAEKRQPTDEEIRAFLSFAFGKLRDELRREAFPQTRE